MIHLRDNAIRPRQRANAVAAMNEDTSRRFWARVDKSGECWIWTGGKDMHGYGKVQIATKTRGTHRVAYIEANGEPADGLVLDHLCRNRACVRPDHLEPVTERTNLLRGEGQPAINAAKTHCVNGHEFDAANTYPMPNNGRACRECRRAAWRRWNAKRTAKGAE